MTYETRRNTLIGLIVCCSLVWFVLPVAVPALGGIIFNLSLPARYLGVFVHEMGHGLGAVVSGGSFFWFQMDLTSGGVAITAGGWRVITLLAGLLGPAFMGAFLLVASVRAGWLKPSLYLLMILFVVGVFFMVRPLWLSSSQFPLLGEWRLVYLLSLVVPGVGLWITSVVTKKSPEIQGFYVQIIAVLVCFSAFSSTDYIFRYEQLGNGLFSDAREVAGIFWSSAAAVPRWWFNVVAATIALFNVCVLAAGTYAALKRPKPKVQSMPVREAESFHP